MRNTSTPWIPVLVHRSTVVLLVRLRRGNGRRRIFDCTHWTFLCWRLTGHLLGQIAQRRICSMFCSWHFRNDLSNKNNHWSPWARAFVHNDGDNGNVSRDTPSRKRRYRTTCSPSMHRHTLREERTNPIRFPRWQTFSRDFSLDIIDIETLLRIQFLAVIQRSESLNQLKWLFCLCRTQADRSDYGARTESARFLPTKSLSAFYDFLKTNTPTQIRRWSAQIQRQRFPCPMHTSTNEIIQLERKLTR